MEESSIQVLHTKMLMEQVFQWRNRERCNDFSIGIELEGSDDDVFTPAQYGELNRLVRLLVSVYGVREIVGHSDIAPGRKTDPGVHFDWMQMTFFRENESNC